MKIQKFLNKKELGIRFLKKYESEENILVSCETSFPFFYDFRILHTVSITMKELSKSLIYKSNLKFMKNCGFVPLPPPNFFNLHLLSDLMKFIMQLFYFIIS